MTTSWRPLLARLALVLPEKSSEARDQRDTKITRVRDETTDDA